MNVFNLCHICFVLFNVAAIENFCRALVACFHIFIGYVVKVIAKNVQKRIDVVKRVIDIDDADKNQNHKDDTKDTDLFKLQRNGKKDKERKVA